LFLLPQTLWSSLYAIFYAYAVAGKPSWFCSYLYLFSVVWFTCRLTAFVYKSFAQAKRYVYIDDNVLSQALIWLASKQKSDGCFESAGSHFNSALKVTKTSIVPDFQFWHWDWFGSFLPDTSLSP